MAEEQKLAKFLRESTKTLDEAIHRNIKTLERLERIKENEESEGD